MDKVVERRDANTFVFAEAFPGAPDEEKAYFAKLEGWHFTRSPRDILIGEYIRKWSQEVLPLAGTQTKREDYQAIIKCWIEPYFMDMTFFELTRLEMQKFISTFKLKIGSKKGQPVSRSRAANIITVLKTIFNDALDEYHWDIPDPFRNVNRYLPKTPRGRRDIFRYDERENILRAFDPWHRPMIEFMMLTGMIHSEISGLRRSDVFANHIEVWQKIVRKKEGKTLKNMYRTRKIPLTNRLREILDHVLARTDSDYVFANPDGSPYLREGFIERYWAPALEKAGVSYRPPYSMRHSFAAWSLLIGVEPLRLVGLMGHSSKKMVFDVYGNYLDGLEQDYTEF